MSNENAFEFYGNDSSTTNTSDTPRVEVDWSKLNAAVVKEVGCESPETVVGVISQIIDLGLQTLPDAKFPNRDDAATMEKNIADGRCYYQEDEELDQRNQPTGNRIVYKLWKQKPVQQVAIAVDFPDIIVDKGVHFGDSKPLPYRLVMGGQYWDKVNREMLVQRAVNLKLMKNTKDQWTLSDKNTLYKMAVAAELIKSGEPFTPNRIGELLGKPFLFEIQAYINSGGYLTERIKFASKLMKGQQVPEYKLVPKVIGFNTDNDIEDVGHLRKEVINTMQRSVNWEASNIKKQLELVKQRELPSKESGVDTPTGAVEAVNTVEPKDVKQEAVVRDAKFEDNFDDDIPFANPLRGKRAMLA